LERNDIKVIILSWIKAGLYSAFWNAACVRVFVTNVTL